MIDNTGRLLVVVGLSIALLGGLFMLLGRVPSFGRLPGDIRIQRENFSCFVPITSMVLLSIIVSVILNIVARVINRP